MAITFELEEQTIVGRDKESPFPLDPTQTASPLKGAGTSSVQLQVGLQSAEQLHVKSDFPLVQATEPLESPYAPPATAQLGFPIPVVPNVPVVQLHSSQSAEHA